MGRRRFVLLLTWMDKSSPGIGSEVGTWISGGAPCGTHDMRLVSKEWVVVFAPIKCQASDRFEHGVKLFFDTHIRFDNDKASQTTHGKLCEEAVLSIWQVVSCL
jgi:hypothetical protein